MLLRAWALVLVSFVLAGCSERTASTADTAALSKSTNAQPGSLPAVEHAATWDSAFGSFVGFGSDSEVVALLPAFTDPPNANNSDASGVNGTRVDLFGPAGLVGSATVSGLKKGFEEPEGCFEFSRGRLDTARVGWTVALPTGRATGIAVETLESLRGSDSSLLAAQIRALAATLPHAQDSVWRNQQFEIDYAGRFHIPTATIVFAATTQMLPGPEHYARTRFFVGERPVTAGNDSVPFAVAYTHILFGVDEESRSDLPSEDEIGFAAAVTPKSNSRPTMLLMTHGNEDNGFAALGRIAPGTWAITWNGPHEGGC